MSTSFSVKKLLSKLGYVSSIAAVASGLTLCTLHDAVLEHKEVYNKGFEAGKLSVTKSQAQACTAWWFGSDTKERHQQAVEAYCKGKI